MKTQIAAHTPDVDRVVEQVKNGDVFSGDWHTLRQIEMERDALRQQNMRLVEALKAIHYGFMDGSIKWAKPRQADTDPYHPANVLMSAALASVGEKT